jgi:hypothetical protein
MKVIVMDKQRPKTKMNQIKKLTEWISFGGVDISNSPKLHAIPITRFGIPEQQKTKWYTAPLSTSNPTK